MSRVSQVLVGTMGCKDDVPGYQDGLLTLRRTVLSPNAECPSGESVPMRSPWMRQGIVLHPSDLTVQ